MKIFLILFSMGLLGGVAFADPTKVGNADTGSDLEKLELITTGVLISTRDRAVELCQKQRTDQISGLSLLIPELQKAEIYLNNQNVSPILDSDHKTETSQDGRFVYARTFAEPHAAVRFFPAALMLSEEQLVQLHIHEALHRALPASIRQSEAVVSELTLALTSQDGSRDRTEAILARVLNSEESQSNSQKLSSSDFQSIAPTEKLKKPSSFVYSYEAFSLTDSDRDLLPLTGMHRIKSLLYPFGDNASVRGLGIQFSYLNFEEQNFVGPLAISANTLFATWRGFDIEGFAEGALYTLSADELKNLPKVRDTMTLGLSLKKEAESFYTANYLAITPGGESKYKIGNTDYIETYQAIVNARIEAGIRYDSVNLGIMGDFLLTEGSQVRAKNGTFSTERERIRAIRFGPHLGYRYKNLQAQVFAQTLLDRTPGYTLSDFGNVMGLGAGVSSVGGSLTFIY